LAFAVCCLLGGCGRSVEPGSDVRQVQNLHELLQQTVLPEVASSGAPRSLSSYMGKAGLLVMFVDVHCPVAAEAMQDVPKVTPILADLKVPTVMINLDDAVTEVQRHYAENIFGVPVLYDTTTGTKNQWGVESVPTLVYITADQRTGYNGVATWKDLAIAVEKHLKLAAGTINFAPKGTGFG